MEMFKRNQIEEAVSKASHPEDAEPGADVRTKLKRLLDTDRELDRDMTSDDPGGRNYAFFSQDAPGSGTEVQYTAYEAFALHLAFRMLIYGCPQRLAVEILRSARPKLEPRHREVLNWGADEPTPDKYLFLLSVAKRKGSVVERRPLLLDQSEMKTFLSKKDGLQFVLQIEVARTAWMFDRLLRKTLPKSRGRGGVSISTMKKANKRVTSLTA